MPAAVRPPFPVGPVLRFLDQPDSPRNLALARLLVFFLLAFRVDVGQIAAFAAFLDGPVFPPAGADWWTSWYPADPAAARLAASSLIAVAGAAAVGLFTRYTAPAATLLAVWVYGIPQMFGALSHDKQHLMWIAALLAVSPCADSLSVDSCLRALRQTRRRTVAPPARSPRYGFPLRMTWVFIGLAYFFPGVWKALAGPAWWASDNLRNVVAALSYADNQVAGPVWLDSYPALLQAAALTVIVFEVGFIAAIFHPATRAVAAAVGLVFHGVTNRLVLIGFHSLWYCYLLFVDWDRLGRRLGSYLPRRRTVLELDPTRVRDRRIAWALAEFDIAQRVPWTYREPLRAQAPATTTGPTVASRAAAATITAVVVAYGCLGIEDGWPVTCLPTFREIHPSVHTSFVVEVDTPDGRTATLRDLDMARRLHPWKAFNIARFADPAADDWDDRLRVAMRLAAYDEFGDAYVDLPKRLYVERIDLRDRANPRRLSRQLAVSEGDE